jgi:hypothetical protein
VIFFFENIYEKNPQIHADAGSPEKEQVPASADSKLMFRPVLIDFGEVYMRADPADATRGSGWFHPPRVRFAPSLAEVKETIKKMKERAVF